MALSSSPLAAPPAAWTTKQVVTALYRTLLRREPDPLGLESHSENSNTFGLEHTMAEFLRSPEFYEVAGSTPGFVNLNFRGPMSVQASCSREELEALWNHISEVWNHLGSTDPLWSVLTNGRYRVSNSPDASAIDDFYEGGQVDKNYLMAALSRNGFEPADFDTLAEYGCGVGRTTSWLAPAFRNIKAFDISAPHLNLARNYLASVGQSNVDFVHVSGPADLEKLQGIDLFFSLIVLQHNPPPIILDVLRQAFTGLSAGGVAVFQVPTHSETYRFALSEYWRDVAVKKEMEIHFLPQRAVLDVAENCGLRALEVRPDHCVGHFHDWMSNTFVLQKR
jgi:SAM-dependent methyltransferase